MERHYVPEVSVHALRGVGRSKVWGVRHKKMSVPEITYDEFRRVLACQSARHGVPSRASLTNVQSAVMQFAFDIGKGPSSPVGSDLRADFHVRRAAHRKSLEEAKRPKAYIRNRLAALATARRALLQNDLDTACAARQRLPFEIALHEAFSGVDQQAKKTACRASGLPLATLKRWMAGAQPNQRSAKHVPELERFLGLPRGALVDLLPVFLQLPLRRKQGTGTLTGATGEVAYRVRQSVLSKEPYALKTYSAQLREQWKLLFRFKTTKALSGRKRSKSGVWTFRPANLQPKKPGDEFWMDATRRRCLTAKASWTLVTQYLGWLTLPQATSEPEDVAAARKPATWRPPVGLIGAGLDAAEVQTLAYLAESEYVEQFVTWRVARSGGSSHDGVERFIKFVSSLTHPETGFLTQHGPELLKSADAARTEDWKMKCASTYGFCKEFLSDSEVIRGVSRDPFEPIESLTRLEDPMVPYRDAILRLIQDRPIAGGIEEATWFRDRVLMKIAVSNPIRVENLRSLTWRADNSGQIHSTQNGGWRIHIPSALLKNRGNVSDYDAEVHPGVFEDLRMYIDLYRPILLAGHDDPGYLFVSSARPSMEWMSMSRHYAALTRRYVANCPGFGLHAARHLVACTILKKASASGQSPWPIVAATLHDREETCRKHYARFDPQDVRRMSHPHISEAFLGV